MNDLPTFFNQIERYWEIDEANLYQFKPNDKNQKANAQKVSHERLSPKSEVILRGYLHHDVALYRHASSAYGQTLRSQYK